MPLTIDSAADHVGEEVATSDWITVTQEMVDAFAGATLDRDWMHVDVARSRRESPFEGTIVQGFLMSSLVIHFSHRCGILPVDSAYGLNYGIDRARYLTPVRTGSRVRDRILLSDFRERGANRYLMKTRHTIEVEGAEKPAAVVEWLALMYRNLDY